MMPIHAQPLLEASLLDTAADYETLTVREHCYLAVNVQLIRCRLPAPSSAAG